MRTAALTHPLSVGPAQGHLPAARPDASDGTRTATDFQQRFQQVRADSQSICQPLETEDYGIQTMPDVSPPKWHLAHTSWFFETFLLRPFLVGYKPFHPLFAHLFNSYYETAGTFHPRAERGLLSRPTVAQVYRYRAHVDRHMLRLLAESAPEHRAEVERRTQLGLHHEQQHQELLLTDIKHIFAYNPLRPTYAAPSPRPPLAIQPLGWLSQAGGLTEIGYRGDGFCYDNETPRHQTFLPDFALASRLTTNGEFLEFMQAGGYRQPEWWLSDGWQTVQAGRWRAPLYWWHEDGEWWHMTLSGPQRVEEHIPVCHVSCYEADAYARWRGKRLPTEAEWETVAAGLPAVAGNFRDSGALHPLPAADSGLSQMFGDCWEWTRSPYSAYPGFRPLAGTLGEYNGKFMSSQMVLRGGSCVTPDGHVRPSYRNFFHPGDRWQFSGIRLAEDR